MTTLDDLVEEAADLRVGCRLPEVITPESVINTLRHTRQSIDRVEEILVSLVRMKGITANAAKTAGWESQDAWDQSAQAAQKAISGRNYTGPRERYSEFNLATISQQRVSRAADQMLETVKTAHDAVRAMHYGLDGLRKDLDSILRAMSIETRLEGG